MKFSASLPGVLFLLLTACAVPESSAGTNPTSETPVTATPVPPGLAPTHNPLQPLSLPTASPVERQRAGETWLYLSTFQSFNVLVVDPLSGHTLHEVPTSGDRAGVGVAPDGTRLYVLDGLPGEEQLRVFDTSTWQVVHQEPVVRLTRTFINPVAFSGDGRWLLVRHCDDDRNRVWNSLFDTQRLRFMPDDAWDLPQCPDDILLVGLLGRPGHPHLYTVCNDGVVALDAETLAALWRRPVPGGPHPDLVLGPDGQRLYGLFPQVTMDHSPDGYQYRVSETDLRLLAWETAGGELVYDIQLSQQVVVPLATIGRGEAGYLAIAPDGGRLYVAWEDRLWALATETLQVVGELQLPAPVDGMVLSLDGGELYLLPATSGDLRLRGHGLWTVSTTTLKLVRRASDWPQNVPLFATLFVAAPAPETHN
ncbi:MAG: hypothetical protein P8186_20360 [Anaerolineae bacterium]